MNIAEATALVRPDPWFSRFDLPGAVKQLAHRVVEVVAPYRNAVPTEGLADMAQVEAEILELAKVAAAREAASIAQADGPLDVGGRESELTAVQRANALAMIRDKRTVTAIRAKCGITLSQVHDLRREMAA